MTRAPAMSAEDRRASIVAATIPLLREKGRAVSTREIARAAGIAEGTIFRVFDNKDQIVTACVHEAFDTSAVLASLAAIDRRLPLRERLAAAVEVMQDNLRGIFTLMTVLQSSGQPLHRPSGADALRRRQQATAELDAAFADLVGDEADRLRIPVARFLGYLRMLTLSSVHPMLDGGGSQPHELVEVLLEGALVRRQDDDVTTSTTATTTATTTAAQRPTTRGND